MDTLRLSPSRPSRVDALLDELLRLRDEMGPREVLHVLAAREWRERGREGQMGRKWAANGDYTGRAAQNPGRVTG